MSSPSDLPNVLVIGIGEYVTGFVHGQQSGSDKPIGVVSVILFDLKRRGLIGSIRLCGTSHEKFEGIRKHFDENIAKRYKDMDVSFEAFPRNSNQNHNQKQNQNESQKQNQNENEKQNQNENQDTNRAQNDPPHLQAIHSMRPQKDICIIFTPDHTHYQLAQDAIQYGLHTLIAKPLVQKLAHHYQLLQHAHKNSVLVGVEVHKRWDPLYSDAWAKIGRTQEFGDFSFFQSYMSQPYTQLKTFEKWAKHSNISYYLNAHHVDFHCWSITTNEPKTDAIWRPVRVTATGSSGVASNMSIGVNHDSITLSVLWKKFHPEQNSVLMTGTAIYTASWIAQKGDVFSQQRFFYQGTKSELTIDQAHRGYTQTTQKSGYQSVNPLFMKYTPDTKGYFSGQRGYGYLSIESFIEAVRSIQSRGQSLEQIMSSDEIASIASLSTILTSVILDAGNQSLERDGANVLIEYDDWRDLINSPPRIVCT